MKMLPLLPTNVEISLDLAPVGSSSLLALSHPSPSILIPLPPPHLPFLFLLLISFPPAASSQVIAVEASARRDYSHYHSIIYICPPSLGVAPRGSRHGCYLSRLTRAVFLHSGSWFSFLLSLEYWVLLR